MDPGDAPRHVRILSDSKGNETAENGVECCASAGRRAGRQELLVNDAETYGVEQTVIVAFGAFTAFGQHEHQQV